MASDLKVPSKWICQAQKLQRLRRPFDLQETSAIGVVESFTDLGGMCNISILSRNILGKVTVEAMPGSCNSEMAHVQ